MQDWLTLNEAYVRAWQGIEPPSGAARRLTAQLAESVAVERAAAVAPSVHAPPEDFAAALAACAGPEEAPASGARDDALAELGLAGMVGRLRRREVTSVALTEQALARMAALEPKLNAVIWLEAEAALRAAAAADVALAAGEDAPLLGVPLAHKDLFADAGRRETAGSAFWRDHVASETATVLARLRMGGSFALGGLNMADFAQNPTGANPIYGNAINPWDAGRICGGSSSGSGVAVAAGYVAASLGTDTGGSIRQPAACCGVTGLKPTWGRVSRFGVAPLCGSLDCVGPIARTALDCALLMDVIAGADVLDPTAAARPGDGHAAALSGDVRGVRIGVPERYFFDGVPAEVAGAVRAAVAVLTEAGAREVAPRMDEMAPVVAMAGTVARAEAAALHAAWMRAAPERFAPHVAARLYAGYAVPAVQYITALQSRCEMLRRFCETVFGDCDVMAVPTLRQAVPTWEACDMDSDVPGTETAFFGVGANVRFVNYLGLPAMSVPCGFDAAGLPVGLQLVGRPFAEPLLLRVADAYQRCVGAPVLPELA